MDESEYQAAVARFLETKHVTRCPTVCVTRTQAIVAEQDRAAYRNYVEECEIARAEKVRPRKRHRGAVLASTPT